MSSQCQQREAGVGVGVIPLQRVSQSRPLAVSSDHSETREGPTRLDRLRPSQCQHRGVPPGALFVDSAVTVHGNGTIVMELEFTSFFLKTHQKTPLNLVCVMNPGVLPTPFLLQFLTA